MLTVNYKTFLITLSCHLKMFRKLPGDGVAALLCSKNSFFSPLIEPSHVQGQYFKAFTHIFFSSAMLLNELSLLTGLSCRFAAGIL